MKQTNMAVQLHHLSKQVKHHELIQPLDYKLPHGNILALCGGNGAGKSTLIRLIVGLLKPTTGYVTINGKTKIGNKKTFSTEFVYMHDDFIFQSSMTAKETIQFYAQIKNIDKKRYEDIMQDVGLLDKLNEKVGKLSKGMKQRLLLAQALLSKPNILILDEPTNGLDPYWVKRFSNIMLKAKETGQTVIFSTHDLHVAEQIADEVMFLASGKVISKGTIQQYLDKGLYDTFQQLYFESVQTVLTPKGQIGK